jgi:hypothetical protein
MQSDTICLADLVPAEMGKAVQNGGDARVG